MLAAQGQFPTFFGRGSRLGPHAGLLITAGARPRSRNVVDLSAIASVGSACSLMIFLLIGLAACACEARSARVRRSSSWPLAATAVVLVFFAIDTLRNAPETFAAIVAIACLAVVLDLVWKRARGEPPAGAAVSVAPAAQE